MELNVQQQAALTSVCDFLNSDASVFILTGFAGTGKTTLIRKIKEEVLARNKVLHLMTPTGRAARVLSEKCGYPATTIHRQIYEFDNIENVDEGNDVKFAFTLKANEAPQSTVIIVDEASMISSKENLNSVFRFGTGLLLKDLLSYTTTTKGGKIIFVGDPLQLPPVGDNKSLALDKTTFESDMQVMTAELTEVMRQDSGSLILANAMKVRKLLKSDIRNNLVFETKKGEVEAIEKTDIVDAYLKNRTNEENSDSIVITFSNRLARDYNNAIRERLYPGQKTLAVGDVLQVVNNHYATSFEERDVLNGDFVTVESIDGETETQTGYATEDVAGKKEKRPIELHFRQVRVRLSDGHVCSYKIIEDLLDSSNASLFPTQLTALYVNFKIRNSGLKEDSLEFKQKLKDDPYYNALRVKYGYAITCHKAQGGEWDVAFVDYSGRTGFSDDCLRWVYTATTRARKTLYGHQVPMVTPLSDLTISEIQRRKNMTKDHLVIREVKETPFHSPTAPLGMKAKYWSVKEAIEPLGFKVSNVQPVQYCDKYTLESPSGVDCYIYCWYGKDGIPTRISSKDNAEEILQLIELIKDNSTLPYVFNYVPSEETLAGLYQWISSICSDLEIETTNVIENLSQYKVIYYMLKDSSFFGLEFFINKKRMITKAVPFVVGDSDDTPCLSLLERMN